MAKQSKTVDQLVDALLGKRAATMSAKERGAAVRAFIDAGTGAVRLQQARTPHQAARVIAQAREKVAHGRMRLAETSTHEDPAILVGPRWRQYQQALEANREALDSFPGVVGYGIGRRRRGGVEVEEPCVVVLVEKKLEEGALRRKRRLALPRELPLPDGGTVPVDVRETGVLRPFVAPGTSLGRSGTTGRGTLGAFAVDLETGNPVALTAMHVVSKIREFPGSPPSTEQVLFSAPCDGEPGAARLGRLIEGTRTGVDAAKISVEPPAIPSKILPDLGPIRGWRPVDADADQGTLVAMYGGQSGRVLFGRIELPLSHVPGLGLGPSIVVDIPAVDGDSGAALVDQQNLVLGLLVGGNTLKVFSPIRDVLKRLSCDILP
jgi:hypothetical protein